MTVLVAHASKHGSTAQIAARVADRLVGAGLPVTVLPVSEVDDVRDVDALVLGCAVYAGSWPKDADAFVRRVAAVAPALPSWVFSSGPVGDPLRPVERPARADAVAALLDPRDHTVFAGALDRSRCGLAERAIAGALRIPDGDYRDGEAIDAWADRTASAIQALLDGPR